MQTNTKALSLAPLATTLLFSTLALTLSTQAKAQGSDDEYFEGPSVGVQAGWEERAIDTVVLPDTLNVPLANRNDGFTYGGYAAYDLQFDNIVIGAEAGFSPNGQTLVAAIPGSGAIELDSKWSGDFTVRAGVTVTPQLLAYGRVGYGINRYRINGFTNGNAQPVASESETADGVIFGGGLEYAVGDNLSLRAEYRRKEFDGSLKSNQVLGGVTLRF